TFLPHLVQNFAVDFSCEPQDEQIGPLIDFGIKLGSGVGSVPGLPNAEAAETIEGGLPGPGIVADEMCVGGGLPNPPTCTDPVTCVVLGAEPPAILSNDFFNSKITFTARNSNAEYATT